LSVTVIVEYASVNGSPSGAEETGPFATRIVGMKGKAFIPPTLEGTLASEFGRTLLGKVGKPIPSERVDNGYNILHTPKLKLVSLLVCNFTQ
jgi:hypothetical protein